MKSSPEYKREICRLAFDIISVVARAIEENNPNAYIPTDDVQYIHTLYNKGDDLSKELLVDEDIIIAAWEVLFNDYE